MQMARGKLKSAPSGVILLQYPNVLAPDGDVSTSEYVSSQKDGEDRSVHVDASGKHSSSIPDGREYCNNEFINSNQGALLSLKM